MTFNDDAQLDTSQVSGGSGGGFRGGGMAIGGGGGIIGVIVLILYMLFGRGGGGDVPVDPTQYMDRSQVAAGGTVNDSRLTKCKTGADANKDDECLVVGVVNSVQDYWKRKFPQSNTAGKPWTMTKAVVYQGQEQSACGTASNQVGPFYCPLDKKVFIDASFFAELSSKFGADGGQFAKMYVVAHEYGHAAQDQFGVLGEAQKDPQGPESGGVRIELMADCFAGMWAKDASTTKDKNGVTLLKPLSQKDITSALSAASAVGDDRIQKKVQGRVSPEKFTHGTAAQRQKWFMTGYTNGDVNSCNTLRAASL